MFETAELGTEVDKSAYKRDLPRLRADLLDVQKRLAGSGVAAVVLMGGVEGAGKSETVNTLLEWLDARGVQVHALGEPSDEERERPPYWRIWRLLPPAGRLAFFVGSWYTKPIIDRAFGETGERGYGDELDRIVSFERMLTDERVAVVKLWLHLSEKQQRRRLEELEEDPRTAWRVTRQDWKFHKRYRRFRDVSELALRKTSCADAPWHIVEASDWRHRNLAVGRIVVDALDAALDRAKKPRPPARPDRPKPRKVNIIRSLDLTRAVREEVYDDLLPRLQGRLSQLTRDLREARRSMILVFEGPDAAGKGGAIRRLTHAMDARNYQVISVAAPTEEERSHPYLWRFWRNLPRLGRVTIYDRSWYGRVLVERLEGFAAPEEWRRAFAEITEFEADLTGFGILVVKFWLAISPAEQLRRFKERQETPYKQHKIGPEDWRNRSKWNAYEAAACDMIERTATSAAPWILVEADDKHHARLKVIKTVVDRLEHALR